MTNNQNLGVNSQNMENMIPAREIVIDLGPSGEITARSVKDAVTQLLFRTHQGMNFPNNRDQVANLIIEVFQSEGWKPEAEANRLPEEPPEGIPGSITLFSKEGKKMKEYAVPNARWAKEILEGSMVLVEDPESRFHKILPFVIYESGVKVSVIIDVAILGFIEVRENDSATTSETGP